MLPRVNDPHIDCAEISNCPFNRGQFHKVGPCSGYKIDIHATISAISLMALYMQRVLSESGQKRKLRKFESANTKGQCWIQKHISHEVEVELRLRQP